MVQVRFEDDEWWLGEIHEVQNTATGNQRLEVYFEVDDSVVWVTAWNGRVRYPQLDDEPGP